jgi:2'-5' RNA ligase
MIWAAGPAGPEIEDLRSKILDLVDQEQENRPFKLHSTLARFRPEDFSKFPIKELNEQVNWRQTVDHIALYESHLSSQGAEYEVIEKIRLK